MLVIDLFFLLRLDWSEKIYTDRHLLMPNLFSFISRLTFQPSVELSLLKLILLPLLLFAKLIMRFLILLTKLQKGLLCRKSFAVVPCLCLRRDLLSKFFKSFASFAFNSILVVNQSFNLLECPNLIQLLHLYWHIVSMLSKLPCFFGTLATLGEHSLSAKLLPQLKLLQTLLRSQSLRCGYKTYAIASGKAIARFAGWMLSNQLLSKLFAQNPTFAPFFPATFS